jgi:ribosomal protein L22
MKARALQRNIHIASRKANLVCNLIRHKKINEALVILDNTEKKVSHIIKKILNSAIANAINNHSMSGEKLYIYQASANQGTTIKRSLPRAKGSAHMIRKRHTHIEIVVSDDINQAKKDRLMSSASKIKRKPKVDEKISSNLVDNIHPVSKIKPAVKLSNSEEGEK